MMEGIPRASVERCALLVPTGDMYQSPVQFDIRNVCNRNGLWFRDITKSYLLLVTELGIGIRIWINFGRSL